MNPIAEQLNQIIESENPHLLEMLSDTGRNLFFPKGILTQSAEAKEKAHRFNATAGIAREEGHTMCFDSVAGAIKGIRPSEAITYAPSFGIPELRKRWQKALFEKNPSLAGKTVSLPVVTNGITHAISMFGDIWLDPGDVVILPEMMWGNYNLILNVRRGARIRHYPLFSEEGGYNLAALEEAVMSEAENNSKVTVILNFPQNPSGYSVSGSEGDRIVEILTTAAGAGTNVIAAMDDSYFGLFYEEETLKESLFAKMCGAHARLLAVKLDGATKENFVWGLRVGFVTYGCAAETDPVAVYDALERKTAGCIRGNISNASHLGQRIVLKSMEDENNAAEKQEKFDILQGRARRVKEVLKDPKFADAWDVYPFNSGDVMCLRLKTVNAETLRVHLLDRYGVGL
ncbi:MAG: aminotransferase class I/II-fold pyridoxal phosphate-dependent enzyme, partial [Deltaproteobacteria bacterium]|nr:aminotransferase class I/II-fold pyridoxal phosphate-dependent enzyme [Deltaproteobacteria bacterium]